MKRFLGLFILVIALAMISGCTQQAQPAAVITPAATTVETAVPTEVATPAPTTEPVPVVTVQNATEMATTAVTTASTPKPVMTPSTKVTTIYVRNNSFVPTELTVLPGTGLTWVNDDATVHAIKATITAKDGIKNVFSTGDLVMGTGFSYTFGANEGTYNLIDTHSNATSVIIVKNGAGLSVTQTVIPTKTA
jgi:plastocyanin